MPVSHPSSRLSVGRTRQVPTRLARGGRVGSGSGIGLRPFSPGVPSNRLAVMPFDDPMDGYYKSLRPIRDRMEEWEQRRRSWGFRAFTIIEALLILGAAASVIGVVPYL